MDATIPHSRRGFCPGVWTPMMSGDGLIVRVRSAVRPLTAAHLDALIALAERHGNAQVELTRRANLQLRGVTEATLPAVQAGLVAAGLADASPARERRLALLASDPLAGLDARSAPLAPLVEALSEALAEAQDLPDLSAKFAIALDGGSGALGATRADVWVGLRPEGCTLAHVFIGGDPASGGLVAAPSRADLPAFLLRLLRALAPARSVRALAAVDREALIARLAQPRSCGCQLSPARAFRPIGERHGQPWLGLAVPLGAGEPALWRALARIAAQHGDGRLRFAPGRAVLFSGIEHADAAMAEARAAGLLVKDDDPLLRVSACAGAPACASAHGETRAFARTLAATYLVAHPHATVHVSGCTKSCAARGPADLTILCSEGGVRLGFAKDVAQTAENPAIPRETAQRRLTASRADDTVGAPMTRQYDYERDGAAIYRRSFAIIRAEANLARFQPIEERVAVRLVHTSGMVELADDIVFSSGFAEAASAAIARGAPIFCDTKMVVSGVTRARLSAHNEVLSFVDHPDVPALAAAQRTTRTAAALSLWGERLAGAVVAIGNAPTALFRLLELLDESPIRPAAIIGLPVGFVGAAESKEALIADGRVPSMIVRGRKGGSAMTAAAINALASEKE